MGRRTEANRLAHKKKVDQKKKRDQDANSAKKDKLKAIQQQFLQQNKTNNEQ